MHKDTQGFHKFRAPTFEEALRQVRSVLGDSAVVLRTTQVKEGGIFGFFGEPLIELTVAGAPQAPATPEWSAPAEPPPRKPSLVERRYKAHSPVGSDQRVRDTVDFCRDLRNKAQSNVEARGEEPAPPPIQEWSGRRGAPAPESPVTYSKSAGSPRVKQEERSRPRRTKASHHLTSEGNAAIAPAPFTRLREEHCQKNGDSMRNDIRELLRILEGDNSSAELPTELAPHYRRLVEAGVSSELAASLLGATVRGCNVGVLRDERVLRERLRVEIRRRVAVQGGISLDSDRCAVVGFIGPTGVGKTTNLAKLGAQFAVRQRCRVAFVTADTYRVAAPDQLRVYADIIGLRMKVVNEPKEMRAAIEELREYDLVLIDTVGSSQFNSVQLDELQGMMEAAEPTEILLGAAANTPLEDLRHICENFGRIGPTSLVFTKIDETRHFGAMYSIAQETGLPVSYFSVGQNVPDDIVLAEPAMVANLVLEGRDRSGRSSRASS
ncbi:MAG: flagellar biosynthesis protein FlhF [Candidatus Hydrogenedentota bacterium]